jgi:voltage-gated potassium channel
MIDLLAILPFYLTELFDFRALRAFRIFRIFRMFKLIRYNRALRRFHIAYGLIKEELILFLMLTFIFLFLASAGIYYFEHDAQPEYFSSIIDSGWWAAVTLTTVGYGDVYPITGAGKIFTLFILLIGVGIITTPAGLIASSLSKARKIQEENLKDVVQE